MAKDITHLIVDRAHRVVDTASSADQAVALTRKPGPFLEVVDLATADVATLAWIARMDWPAGWQEGAGLLGAGTHPAQPYGQAMLGMRGVDRNNVSDIRLGYDSADVIVTTWLSNAQGWRGETARLVKAALKGMLK